MIIWLSWPWNFLGQVACFSPLYVIYHHFLSFFFFFFLSPQNSIIRYEFGSKKNYRECTLPDIFLSFLSDKEKDIGSRKNIILEFYLANIQYFFEFLCKELQKKCFQRTERRIGGLNMNEWMSSYYCCAGFSECLFL